MKIFAKYTKSSQRLLAATLLLSSFAGLSGCSSSKYVKSEIVSNSDRSLKTPEWVLSPTILKEEEGDVIYIHKTYLEGSGRPDACTSIARTQAIGEMMKYIKNAVTTSGQVEELNASSDPSYSALVAFLSQGNLSGARVTTSYWERSMEPDETGMRGVSRLMCAVQVAINKSTLDRQMRDAINGAPGGNPEIRQKLLNAQKSFIESVGKKEGNTGE